MRGMIGAARVWSRKETCLMRKKNTLPPSTRRTSQRRVSSQRFPRLCFPHMCGPRMERSGRLFEFGQKDFQGAQRGEQLFARNRIRAEGQRSDQEAALPQVQFSSKHCRGETHRNFARLAFQSPRNIICHSRPELIQRGQIRELP